MISAICLCAIPKEKEIKSLWTESIIKIDGLDDEWTDSSINYQKKVKVKCAFKNDADNLYILFIFEDPEYLTTIKGTGMTIWLNTEGKKKKRYGINFKLKRVTAETLISILERQQGSLPEVEKERIMSNPQYFLYRGEVIDKKGHILTASALGGELEAPIFKSRLKQKMRVYEFRIPCRILEKLSSGQRMEPGKSVRVGFEWGGLTEEMKIASLKRLSESESRGPEPIAQGESITQRTRRDPIKYSFWVDVLLAQI